MAPLQPGDYVCVHDAGANSLSLWSRHCSRLVPPVHTFERLEGGGVRVNKVKEAESLERLLEVWK